MAAREGGRAVSSNSSEHKPAFYRFQSNFVLPIGRIAFLLGAAGCLVGVAGGLLVAAFLTFRASGEPEKVPVPDGKVNDTFSLNLSTIDTRL